MKYGEPIQGNFYRPMLKKASFGPVTKVGRILQVFLDSDLRSGHDGLSKIAERNKVDTKKLGAGQYLVFINRSKTMVKVFTGNQIIAHHKSRRGRITMDAIKFIPEAFTGSGDFYMEAAIKKSLQEILARRKVKTKSAAGAILKQMTKRKGSTEARP
jgi:hypothetical protein